MPARDETVKIAVAANDAAEEVKTTDPVLLDVGDLLGIAELFLIVSASSDRQLHAAAERIEHRLREHGRRPHHREGSASAGWLLLDFGDLVCHLFLTEQRDVYSLERLWADVARRDPHTGEPTTSVASRAGGPPVP